MGLGRDGEHQLADPIGGGVAAEIDHVQPDAVRLQLGEYFEGSRANRNMRSSLGVMTTSPGLSAASRAALRTVAERLRSGDTRVRRTPPGIWG
jgi:hypothetical protein